MPNDLLNALRRKVAAYTAAGRLDLVEKCEARIAAIDASAPEPEPEPGEDRDDGVHAVGGGWFEIIAGGELVKKMQGADAARDAYEKHKGGE